MTHQETYDPTLDAPPAAPPNEDYYRQPGAPRRNGRARGLGVALVLVGILLLAFQIFGRGIPFGSAVGAITLIDKTLPGNRIELVAAASDVEVRTWDGAQIRVEATQRGGARGDYTIDVTQSGDTVHVTESTRNFFSFFGSRSLSYRISVPKGAQADIKTASGEIDVSGVGGAVSLNSVSGDVRASDLTGGLTVGTSSGEVTLHDIDGKLAVSTISGDVQLEDGKVDNVSVSTTSGEVKLQGVAGPLNLDSISGDITVSDAQDGQLTISTTSGGVEYDGGLARGGSNTVNSISGDVELQLPEDSGFRLDASTVSGDLDSDFDLQGGEQGRRALSGVAGTGDTTLKIDTTSGSIHIRH